MLRRTLLAIGIVWMVGTYAQFSEAQVEPEQDQDGTGLYYMKARFYDPEIGRFLTVDPVEGDPRVPGTLHKYLYALNNPLVYVDPDGREVRALGELALERIRSTLPKDLRAAVVADSEGLLRPGPIQAIKSDNPNVLALQELVSQTRVVAVETVPSIQYLDASDRVRRRDFVYETPEEIRADLVAQGLSKAEAENLISSDVYNIALGVFLTPRDSQANTNPYDDRQERSLTNEATVVLPDGSMPEVPEIEHAMTTAHELYGHGLLYVRDEEFTHPPVPNAHFGEIQERTRKTFMDGLVVENPDGLGTKVVPAHENQIP